MDERYIDAFELLLAQKLLVIQYNIEEMPPKKKELQRIGKDLGIGYETVGKFF